MALKSRYRFLGHGVCGCGQTFTITAKNPNQRFCGKTCPHFMENMAFNRALAARRLRDDLILGMLKRSMTSRGTLDRATLQEFGRNLYDRAYSAGYQKGRKERITDEAIAKINATATGTVDIGDQGMDEPEAA